MNALTDFFNQYILYVIFALLLVQGALVVGVLLLYRKLRHIFRDDSVDIGRVLMDMRSKQDAVERVLTEAGTRISALESALPRDLQKVGLVRYNPFSDAGGDQSFALALLDGRGNGVVISSLYGREMNRVYAKRIEGGAAKYPLTDEEKEALHNAQ